MRIQVQLGARSYQVWIGRDILAGLGAAVAACGPGRRALLVADGAVADLHAPLCASSLHAAGFRTHLVLVPPGEASKTLQGAARLYDACLDSGLDRSSFIVALGGGVTGDLAGFAAATFMRGISFVQVPTTLLAQVDASVGGKVAVDHPRGKNLIGAFHQPALVWCDVSTLDSLPAPEFAAGLAEAVKHGLLGGARYYGFIRRHLPALAARESAAVQALVAGSVRIKAAVVAADEREEADPAAGGGTRLALNLGHTLAHALEAVAGFGALRHGEAVAIGLVAAGRLALGRGVWPRRRQLELEAVLAALGLPCRIPGLSAAELLQAMRVDKKALGGTLRYVLPVAPGQVAIASDVGADELAGVLLTLGATA